MQIKELCKLIDERQNELYELLGSLIRINSENFGSSGNERELAEHIDSMCKEIGLESEVYSPLSIEGFEDHPDYLAGRGLENRLNVTARYSGLDESDGLMLMAHIDTVEIGDKDNWSFPPLSGEIRDGRIYGRGACDDKYALATVLFLFKLLKENSFVPKRSLLFSGYCDEEHGGSHGALASVLKYPCDRILNMDGRDGQIWHCGTGGGVAKFAFHTKKTVDSARLGALAIPMIIEELDKFAEARRCELEANPYYAGTIIPSTALRYMSVKVGNDGMDLGCGEISFTFYTTRSRDEIYSEFGKINEILKAKLDAIDIESDGFTPKTRFFHYVHCATDSPHITDLLSAAKEATGEDIHVCGSCLSDLSVISKYGSSAAYAYGAGRDFSLAGGAHQPNEFIECKRLLNYTKNIGAYILKALG